MPPTTRNRSQQPRLRKRVAGAVCSIRPQVAGID